MRPAQPIRITIPYAPRKVFRAFHATDKRFAIVVAHRRCGKTMATINRLIRSALTIQKPDPRCAYIAPFYAQAKDVAWTYLKRYSSAIPGAVPHEGELRVDFPNGGRVRLYGADNYDRMRGIYLDDAVLDEYADMDPRAWSSVIRPALSDRQGKAVFIGTPKGANDFKTLWDNAEGDPDWFRLMLKASETGLLPDEELAAARRMMTDDEYAAEFECSFAAGVRGAFYAKELAAAEAAGRIGRVPHAQELPVNTAWDLGIDDATAIWFWQAAGMELRILGYYEQSGASLSEIVQDLVQIGRSKGYMWGDHYLPHDVEVRELATGRSRREMLTQLGLSVLVVPNIPIADGINAARVMMGRCWFDKEACERGLSCLTLYQREFDEKRKVFNSRPRHDFTSHAADAFRMLALSYSEPVRWEYAQQRDYRGRSEHAGY